MTADIRYQLLFDIRRSVRYHQRRRAFFERFHAGVMFVGIVAGSAAVTAMAGKGGVWFQAVPVAAFTILSAGSLVFGVVRKAWLHAELARRFIDLEREVLGGEASPPTGDRLSYWQDRRLAIERDEPPVLRVLDTLCHNEMIRAERQPDEYLVPVGFLPRWLSGFGDFGDPRKLRAP